MGAEQTSDNHHQSSSPSLNALWQSCVPTMAATFNIQKPYVLTTLPRSLNRQGNGSAYAVGDVWGQQQGSKKRKRPELALGIDGEAVNLYDVCSSLLPSHMRYATDSFH